jgi:hypothetical protein
MGEDIQHEEHLFSGLSPPEVLQRKNRKGDYTCSCPPSDLHYQVVEIGYLLLEELLVLGLIRVRYCW